MRENIRVSHHQIRRWVLAAALLASMGCIRAVLYRQPPQAEAYYQRVVAVAAAIPTRFDSWVSQEAPIPQAAITMLRPNLTVSRTYTNLQTGQQAKLLLVQCRDARDLIGHFPPVCYVAHGFRAVDATPRKWRVDDLVIEGMLYSFSSTRPDELTSMIIYDFMILPDGHTCPDMQGVNEAARDLRKRQLGAAQLQIVMDPNMSEEERDALFTTLIQANRLTIDAILAGEKL